MTTLTPKLAEVVNKVSALQHMKDESGFQTKRTIRQILSPLSPEELTLVAEALYTK